MSHAMFIIFVSCFLLLAGSVGFAKPPAPVAAVLKREAADQVLIDSISETQLSRRIDQLERSIDDLDRKIGRLEDKVDRYHR